MLSGKSPPRGAGPQLLGASFRADPIGSRELSGQEWVGLKRVDRGPSTRLLSKKKRKPRSRNRLDNKARSEFWWEAEGVLIRKKRNSQRRNGPEKERLGVLQTDGGRVAGHSAGAWFEKIRKPSKMRREPVRQGSPARLIRFQCSLRTGATSVPRKTPKNLARRPLGLLTPLPTPAYTP